jgi:hypothetical protein
MIDESKDRAYLEFVNAVITTNPGTEHTYRPSTPEQERERRQRYARMVALETLRLFAKRPAHEPEALPAQLLDVHAICDERDRLRKEFFELAHRLMNAGRFEDANEISKILGSSRPPPGVRRAHKWDGPGERCVVCGDKDWMQTDCQPDEEQLRTELRRALDFYVANHSRLSHLMEAVEAVCGPRPTPTKCAESPCDPSGG